MILKGIFTFALVAVIMTITSAVDQDAGTVNPKPTKEIIMTKISEAPNVTMSEPEDKALNNKTAKDKTALQHALDTVLNPEIVVKPPTELDTNKTLTNATKNETLGEFFEAMDQSIAEFCRKKQEAVWTYETNTSNRNNKNAMLAASREDNEMWRNYWAELNKNYYKQIQSDPDIKRKARIIKERALSVLKANSQLSDDIDKMQGIWTSALVCAYNTSCGPREVKGFGGQYFFYHHRLRHAHNIISVFKTSRDLEELLYYWKAFHDTTGPRIRPVFQDYIQELNSAAKRNNFSNAGELFRFSYEDDYFKSTVKKVWDEVKPLYNLLKDYVRDKLRKFYGDAVKDTIPAHMLGNLWPQDWQSIYPIVAPHPERNLMSGYRISSRSLFEDAAQFLRSMGFRVQEESFNDVDDFQKHSPACVPFSQDACDGINYRIRWCGRITPAISSLSQAAKLLTEVQYYEQYRNRDIIFRRPPIPAFKTAISDLIALQMTSPEQLKRFHLLLPPLSPEVHVNHMMWVALEKLPLLAYAYVLDSWRWDVFEGEKEWNHHWWSLRMEETGISPPVERNETHLDPAAKYHVVANQEYITYFVSTVLQFQILRQLCKITHHKGPLHRCSLYEASGAGLKLRTAMGYGATKNWEEVLRDLTTESQLSTEGILEYFKPLQEFLLQEHRRSTHHDYSGEHSIEPVTFTIGIVVGLLSIGVVIWYCIRKYNRRNPNSSIEMTRVNESIGEAKF